MEPNQSSPSSPHAAHQNGDPVALPLGRATQSEPTPRRSWPWLVALVALGILLVSAWGAFHGQRFTGAGPRLTVSEPGRLALLPWINATGDPAYDWVSIGLMEVVAQAIEETPEVQTVPVARVHRALRRRQLDVADDEARARARGLMSALGAGVVLETTLRRGSGGAPLRLEAALFKGPEVVSSATFAGDDAVRMAEQLADGVARGLNPDALRVNFERLLSGDSFFDQLYARGVQALRAGRIDDAESYLDIVLRDRPRFLLARARLADCAVAGGDLEAARVAHVAILENAQGRGDQYLQAASLLALSDVAARRASDDEADELARQAEAIYLALGDRARQLETLDVRSRLALAGRRAQRAEALFVEILQVQRALGDRLGEIDTLRQLGSASLTGGDLPAAADLLGEAREQARALGDVAAEMTITASLGEVAARQERFEDADQLWAEALAYYRDRKDQRRMLLLAEKRANMLWAGDSLDRAEAQFQDVQTVAVALGDEASEGRAALALADILLRKGYPYQARPQLDRALELDRLIDDPLAIQRVIARFAHAQGDHRIAVVTLRDARAQAGAAWTEDDAALLERFEKARREAERP